MFCKHGNKNNVNLMENISTVHMFSITLIQSLENDRSDNQEYFKI